MEITNFTPWSALIGGILIGLSTGIVLFMNGKLAGISGVLGRIFRAVPGDTGWRVWFVAGLVIGGAAVFRAFPPAAAYVPVASTLQMAVAGLLVGFGARLGGGCTSGHGVCGISRGSVRSLIGTITFMAAGFVTVFLVNHVWGLR